MKSKDIKKTKETKKDKKREGSSIWKTFVGRNWSTLLSVILATAFMLAAMITMKVTPFGTNSFTLVDSIHQYVPFFSDYQDKLLTGKSLSYTWDVGMGQNFQSLLLYYMASPLNLIVVFFSRKGIITMFSILVAVKIVISAGCFSHLLSRRGGEVNNNLLITAMSLCYALCNYMCGYYWNIMWLDCIMIFPLIILGFERMTEKGDIRLYVAALFYSMYCNYYISFIICIFLVLWFLATNHKNLKKFFVDGLIFAGSSILAAGMASISLIVAYLAITKTASAGTPMPSWNWYQSIFEIIKGSYFLSKPVTMSNFDGLANIYCGTLAYVLIFVYLFSNKIKIVDKIQKILLLVFMLISMNQELLNFIWHGFHNQYGIPNRFSFIYVFLLIYLGYDVLKTIKETSIISIVVGIIAAATVLFVTTKQVEFDVITTESVTIMSSFALIGFYGLLLLLKKITWLPESVTTVFMAIMLIAEVMANGLLGMNEHGGADGEYYTKYTEQMQAASNEVEKLAEAKGQQFYRSEVVDPIMLDENTYNNMRSIGTFCSTVRGDMVDTMAHLGFYTGANEYLYLGNSIVTNDMFGIKYIYTRDGDYFPATNDYKQIYNEDGVYVYENPDAFSIAYGVSDLVTTDWYYEQYNAASVLDDFAYYAYGVPSLFRSTPMTYSVEGTNCTAEFDPGNSSLISYGDGEGDTISIHATAVVGEMGRYYLNCRANYLENIVYYRNGEEVASGRYQTQLMDLGELYAGDTIAFDIEFDSNYSPEGTISMYMAMLDRDGLAKFRGNQLKYGMTVTEFTDNEVKGKISVGEEQIIFTSIPFDEGWRVYLDGEKLDPDELEMVAGGFLGIPADPGQHELRLKFVPDGRTAGIILTSVSWLIYIFFFIMITRGGSKHFIELTEKFEREDEEEDDEEPEYDDNLEEEIERALEDIANGTLIEDAYSEGDEEVEDF